MGCDIHVYTEAYDPTTQLWRCVDKITKDKYWTPDSDYPEYEVAYEDELIPGRNYRLFAMLAGVRNDAEVVPIAEPKGLPDDISDFVLSHADGWRSDGHNHSHLTLTEILAYDWNQETKQEGWVDIGNYVYWKRRGYPNWSAGDVGGGGSQKVSNLEMEHHLDDYGFDQDELEKQAGESFWSKPGCPNIYTQVKWAMPYWMAARDFYRTTIPKLELMCEKLALDNPSYLRIVFWFDN